VRDVALIITPKYLPFLGGMERECALLSAELRRRGWTPVVITEQLATDAPRDERVDGIRIHRIPSSPRRSLAIQLRVAAQLTLLVLRYRRRAAFAIVRTTTLPALVVGLLKRLRLVSFPTLATAETGGLDDDVAALARRPLFPASRALVSAHDWLNGLCQANVDHLREHGFPEQKITMIPNGIDTAPWSRTSTPDHVSRFLFLGRLDPEKGLFELLDAFADVRSRHPDVSLTVAGEGPARAALASRAEALGIGGAVRFAGLVPYERLGTLFEEHDSLVLPSYSEGMPLSVLEAAAHRRVLIVTDVGDMRRLFGDRIRVCPPRDSAALAAAMEGAVVDPAPSADYGDVIEKVSIETVTDAFVRRLLPQPLSRR
jgi:glycosyltransferase involved in cell wall biosynthesis